MFTMNKVKITLLTTNAVFSNIYNYIPLLYIRVDKKRK